MNNKSGDVFVKKFWKKVIISAFSGFFGRLLAVIVCVLGFGYLSTKIPVSSEGGYGFWNFMRSCLFIFAAVSPAMLFSGFFDRIMDWRVKTRELKIEELKLKKEILELELEQNNEEN